MREPSPVHEALEKDMEKLKQEIEALKANINDLQLQVNQFEGSKTPTSNQTSSHQKSSIRSSLTILENVVGQHLPIREEVIPQLDGALAVYDVQNEERSYQCVNCRAIFENERKLKEHQDKHEFGCDECYICYETKFHVDLHELEKHGNSTYARDHIPYTTKLQFSAGCRVPTYHKY